MIQNQIIPILNFLGKLSMNNTQEWFHANKTSYENCKKEFEKITKALITDISKFDKSVGNPEPKDCIFRIYRDVRFSHDKTPYKTNFGCFIAPGGRKSAMAGYYLHLDPDASFLGGGIYMPQPEVLKKLRNGVLQKVAEFKKIIHSKNFIHYFNKIEGEQLKRTPKDFPSDWPDADLLKYKSYSLLHPLPEDILESKDVMNYVVKIFKQMLPFNAFLNTALDDTTPE